MYSCQVQRSHEIFEQVRMKTDQRQPGHFAPFRTQQVCRHRGHQGEAQIMEGMVGREPVERMCRVACQKVGIRAQTIDVGTSCPPVTLGRGSLRHSEALLASIQPVRKYLTVLIAGDFSPDAYQPLGAQSGPKVGVQP